MKANKRASGDAKTEHGAITGRGAPGLRSGRAEPGGAGGGWGVRNEVSKE